MGPPGRRGAKWFKILAHVINERCIKKFSNVRI